MLKNVSRKISFWIRKQSIANKLPGQSNLHHTEPAIRAIPYHCQCFHGSSSPIIFPSLLLLTPTLKSSPSSSVVSLSVFLSALNIDVEKRLLVDNANLEIHSQIHGTCIMIESMRCICVRSEENNFSESLVPN